MMSGEESWLAVTRGHAPLVLSVPHAGTEIPADVEPLLVSAWRGNQDADWHVDRLYDFAPSLGVSVIRTGISRTAIDVNRDPSGASLYPGMATTGLCPTHTFDGEPLYRTGCAPADAQIHTRRARWFDPYHAALRDELARLRRTHPVVVLYDAHSIRSRIPRLFEGELPQFNLGTFDERSCAPSLQRAVESVCDATSWSRVTNGRFKGGWTTRHHGRPQDGVHAVQMELACRGYLREPAGGVNAGNWPVPYEPAHAAPLRGALTRILETCIDWAVRQRPPEKPP